MTQWCNLYPNPTSPRLVEHPCNVKRVKILAGINEHCMTEILQVDLTNDSRAETFRINSRARKHTSQTPWPSLEARYLKIVPISVHGSSVAVMGYFPSIWRVSLTGIVHDWKAYYLERRYPEHCEPPYSPFDLSSDADIIFQSRGGVDFRLHRDVLAKVSSVWQDMLSFPQDPESDPAIPQVVTLTEDTKTLDNIFRLCYPATLPHFTSIDNVCAALDAANKYMMDPIIAQIENSLLQFLDSEPLRVYSVAYIYQCGNVARAAARRLVADPSFADPPYPPPEFDYLPAIALSAVGAYRRKYIKAALNAFGDHEWMHSGNHARRFPEFGTRMAGGPGTWVWLQCTSCPVEGGGPPMTIKRGTRSIDNVVYPTKWWQKYFDAAERELSLWPFGSVVTEPRLTWPAIKGAGKCRTCGARAVRDLMEYTDMMAERIGEATHKVS
ncbi:hypothetical protein C8Q78DRAFT_540439 [Trametes maxima]|nr:hypothetical protein C8Q78DRAFT_540439 [Trametes maxima]